MSEDIVAVKTEQQDIPRVVDNIIPSNTKVPNNISPPPSEYELLNGKPYLAFKYEIPYNEIKIDLDVFKIREKTKIVSDYILRSLMRKQLKESRESYDRELNDLEYQAGIDIYEESKSKIDKLYWHIRNLEKLLEINKELQ